MRWNIAAQGNVLKEGQRVGHLDIYSQMVWGAVFIWYGVSCILIAEIKKIDGWWASNLLEIKTNLGLWNINVVRKLSFLSFFVVRMEFEMKCNVSGHYLEIEGEGKGKRNE